MKKQLLITFDYELFLGKRSGTVENCMIKPTDLALDVLRENNIQHAIFFVDTTCLLKMQGQNENTKKDLEKVKKQLVAILKSGHYVFPHLHPHWLDAKYLDNINQWDLSDITRYRLHKLDINEIERLLEGSINMISSIQKEAGVNYPIDTYRAGGWCLQPFEKLRASFLKFGLKNDFSVLHGFSNNNENCYYDYSKVPADITYKFNNDVTVKDASGPFTEFTISSIEISPTAQIYGRLLNKFLAYTKDLNFGDGISNSLSADKQAEKSKKEMVSIELLNAAKLGAYIQFFDSNKYMQFISHPKMISPHNLKTFRKFLKHASKKELITDHSKMLVQ